MSNALKRHLKLLALKAIPEIERRAVEWYIKNGEKIIGTEKRKQAVEYIMDAYKIASANVPGLNLTTIDDELVRAGAIKALDWAWAEMGDIVNEASKSPVTDDASLPKGGVK